MGRIISTFCFITLLFLISACNKSVQQRTSTSKAKNVILLIGDGMGLQQLSSAYYFQEKEPNFNRFKIIGLHQTRPIGAKVTDSASSATAFSTGYKTFNKAIGVDKDSIPRETILEWASKRGKSTGLIATCTITHATPGSFYAHCPDRGLHEDIALDFLNSPVDFAAAAGYKYFNEREDGRDLLSELESRGAVVDTNNLEEKLILGKQYVYLLGSDSLLTMNQGRGDFLHNASQIALNLLNQDKDGFFLMIESSQIDWAGHKNDAERLIAEVLDFDRTIGTVLDFAERKGNTLVVVTGDHETGGFALAAPKIFGKTEYKYIKPSFSTKNHTATLIPVFAYGPGAEAFQGIYQNNDIFDKMKKAFQ